MLALGVAGCASVPIAPVPGDANTSVSVASIPTAELETQRLYRVRYQGPQGDGSLRLVLKLEAPDRFSIAASDTFGRAVWSLAFADSETRIVDHRAKTHCATGADVRVPEAALAPLPIGLLPSVLLGRLPVMPERLGEGEVLDFLDSAGRRWTARIEEGEPRAWTLWRGGEPSLWWQPQGTGGGVLSHRSGSQFRWRETGNEPLATSTEPPPPPDGYPRVSCDDWGVPEPREDQPAPSGVGSPV